MYVERDLEGIFQKMTLMDKAIALVGPRQSGKTTFLKKRISESVNYLLFDDPDIRSLFEEDVKAFQSHYLEGNDVTILDEVQNCKDAGINLKYLNDTGNRVWITSSSELLLGKQVLSYLVGRVSILRIYPFSLSEFMRANKQLPSDRKQVLRSVRDMVAFGCYPDIVLTKDPELKEIQLRNLYETIVLKDIAKVFNIDDIDALQRTIRYLSNMFTGMVNMDNISRNLSISFKTLRFYILAMEKSYLIRSVRPYFTNPNKELVKQPKIYFLDNGMRNIISGNIGMKVDGTSFENLVFTELLKLGYEPKYWRKKTGLEVDFIIPIGNEMIPIEVKLKAPNHKVESGLRSYIKLYIPLQSVCSDVRRRRRRNPYQRNKGKVHRFDGIKRVSHRNRKYLRLSTEKFPSGSLDNDEWFRTIQSGEGMIPSPRNPVEIKLHRNTSTEILTVEHCSPFKDHLSVKGPSAFLTGFCLVDLERSSEDLLPVEFGYGLLRLFIIRHLNESKSFGPVGCPVYDDLGGFNNSVFFESLLQVCLSHIV